MGLPPQRCTNISAMVFSLLATVGFTVCVLTDIWSTSIADGMFEMHVKPWRSCVKVSMGDISDSHCENTADTMKELSNLWGLINKIEDGSWGMSSSSGGWNSWSDSNSWSNSGFSREQWLTVEAPKIAKASGKKHMMVGDVNCNCNGDSCTCTSCDGVHLHEIFVEIGRSAAVTLIVTNFLAAIAALFRAKCALIGFGILHIMTGMAPAIGFFVVQRAPFCSAGLEDDSDLMDMMGAKAGPSPYIAAAAWWATFIASCICCCVTRRDIEPQQIIVVQGGVPQQQPVYATTSYVVGQPTVQYDQQYQQPQTGYAPYPPPQQEQPYAPSKEQDMYA